MSAENVGKYVSLNGVRIEDTVREMCSKQYDIFRMNPRKKVLAFRLHSLNSQREPTE